MGVEKLEFGIHSGIGTKLRTGLIAKRGHSNNSLNAANGRKRGPTAIALAFALAVGLREAKEVCIRDSKWRATGGGLGIDRKEISGLATTNLRSAIANLRDDNARWSIFVKPIDRCGKAVGNRRL